MVDGLAENFVDVLAEVVALLGMSNEFSVQGKILDEGMRNFDFGSLVCRMLISQQMIRAFLF